MPSFQKPSFGQPKAARLALNALGAPSRSDAEAIGLAALVFLTEDDGRLARFLGDTGMSPGELAQAAGRPEALGETLVAVLDHLLADESMLLVFAAHARIDPAAIGPAQDALQTPRER